ncbi:hypothetical protein [Shinella sp. BYT-45]|uniref:hypothetical protein n=1 Tax=Shinella sp. BYT-45 TaxID=3377377 RepID=UPI00397ED38E
MKRRSFLAAFFAAPIIPAVAKIAETPSEAMKRIAEDEKMALKVADIGHGKAGRITSPGGAVVDLDAGTIMFPSDRFLGMR